MNIFKFQAIVFILFFLLFSFAFPIKAQDDADSWLGEYKYTHSEGENAGGMAVVLEYKIVVTKKGDGFAARFKVDGYQGGTTDYECRAEIQGSRLNLYVVRDLADRDGLAADFRPQPGQLLASLLRMTVRGKIVYLFKNGKYEIYPNDVAAKYPVYFRRKK